MSAIQNKPIPKLLFCKDMITNAYKLSMVLTRWIQPVLNQLASNRMSMLPFVSSIENKVRSIGWVSPSWSLAQELSPILNNISGSLVQPFLQRYVSNVPDESIPKMAHNIVDEAIKNGGLSLFEGSVTFELDDLKELKKLLDYNLPYRREEEFEVKMKDDAPTADGDSSAEKITN